MNVTMRITHSEGNNSVKIVARAELFYEESRSLGSVPVMVQRANYQGVVDNWNRSSRNNDAIQRECFSDSLPSETTQEEATIIAAKWKQAIAAALNAELGKAAALVAFDVTI
jgi:hypothetical protein